MNDKKTKNDKKSYPISFFFFDDFLFQKTSQCLIIIS